MTVIYRSTFVFAFTLLLAACNNGNLGNSNAVQRHFSINNGVVAVHNAGATDAIVDAVGTLTIGGKTVDTTAAQRSLLAHYHAGVFTLRSEGIALGRAGIKTAGTAVTSVVEGLASGDPNTIGDKVEAQAKQIESHVGNLCDTLRDLRSTQEAIAGQVQAFQPYATITADEVDHCR